VLRRTDDFDPFDAPTASDDAAAAFGAPVAHIANEVTGDDLFEGGGGFTSAAPAVEPTPVLAAPVPVAAAVRVAASAKAATFATDETDAIKCERPRLCALAASERESEREREKMRFFLIIAVKTDRYFGLRCSAVRRDVRLRFAARGRSSTTSTSTRSCAPSPTHSLRRATLRTTLTTSSFAPGTACQRH
jgi:hypothetical protein